MLEDRQINTFHPRQDVHRLRERRSGLSRYQQASAMLPTPASTSTCLELGGGMAEFAEVLRERGYTVTFTDLSEHNVRHASEIGFESVQLDLNEGLKAFSDGSFDAVTMLEIIEHVVQAEKLIRESLRVLRPGGFLILSTPNAVWWPERLRSLLGLSPSEEGYHYRFFTVATMKKLLRECGFRIADERYTTPAFGINLIRRLCCRLGRIHVRLPRWAASLGAQTMFLRGVKDPS